MSFYYSVLTNPNFKDENNQALTLVKGTENLDEVKTCISNSVATLPSSYKLEALYKCENSTTLERMITTFLENTKCISNGYFTTSPVENIKRYFKSLKENLDFKIFDVTDSSSKKHTEISIPTLFKKTTPTNDSTTTTVVTSNTYHIKGHSYSAVLKYENNQWVLKAGSIINPITSSYLKESSTAYKKREYIFNNCAEKEFSRYLLTEDIICKSPREGAMIISGRTVDSHSCWKTMDNKPLKYTKVAKNNKPTECTNCSDSPKFTVSSPHRTYSASLTINKNKTCTINKGAKIKKNASKYINKFSPAAGEIRKYIISNKNKSEENKMYYTLKDNIDCKSVYEALCVVMGVPKQNYKSIKTNSGSTVGEVLNA